MKYRFLVTGLMLAGGLAHAGQDVSVGLGFGPSYSSTGMNVALRSDDHLAYVSYGCISISHSSRNGWDTACGPGIGWWNASLLGDSRRHALGVYFGPVDHEGYQRNLEVEYGVGAGYSFFWKGVGRPGPNLGAMRAFTREYGETETRLLLQFGYQF